MERYVYNSEKKVCGRADIYNIKTGEVWELKTVRTGAEAANNQVEKYCANYLKDSSIPITKGDAGMFPGRFAGSFPLSCMDDYYTVVYYTPQPGVILYWVIKSKKDEESDPYAVYVPTPQTTPERRTTIGGVPQYGYNSVGGGPLVAYGLATVGLGFAVAIGGGFFNDRSVCFN